MLLSGTTVGAGAAIGGCQEVSGVGVAVWLGVSAAMMFSPYATSMIDSWAVASTVVPRA